MCRRALGLDGQHRRVRDASATSCTTGSTTPCSTGPPRPPDRRLAVDVGALERRSRPGSSAPPTSRVVFDHPIDGSLFASKSAATGSPRSARPRSRSPPGQPQQTRAGPSPVNGQRRPAVATVQPTQRWRADVRPVHRARSSRRSTGSAWCCSSSASAASWSPAITGLAVARSALLPVRRLSAAAEHIARTEELTPIAVTGDDELASLATSFNEMLAALAASRDRQRRLVADAGHELRTPLTSLRTNLDLLAQADRHGGMRSGPARRDLRRRDRAGRGAVDPGRRPGRAGPRRAARIAHPSRSTSPTSSPGRSTGSAGGASASTFDVELARGGCRRGQTPRARGDQPARQRRQVEPAGRHGHGQPDRRGARRSATKAPASTRPTCR